MDIHELLRLKDTVDRPRSIIDQLGEATRRSIISDHAFDQRHFASMRSVVGSDAFNYHKELLRMKQEALVGQSSLSNLWSTHLDRLNESATIRALRDPFFGIERESSFLAAQLKVEQDWKATLADLAGLSTRSSTAISAEYLSRLKADLAPTCYSYVERQTEALRRSIRMVAEHPSASAFASLTETINGTSFLAAAKWMRGIEADTGLIKKMFEPSIAYGQFSARTLAKLVDPISDSHRAALAGSLLLAER